MERFAILVSIWVYRILGFGDCYQIELLHRALIAVDQPHSSTRVAIQQPAIKFRGPQPRPKDLRILDVSLIVDPFLVDRVVIIIFHEDEMLAMVPFKPFYDRGALIRPVY